MFLRSLTPLRLFANSTSSSPLAHEIVTLIGGNGFVGRAIIASLVPYVREIRVVSRTPNVHVLGVPDRFLSKVAAVPADASDASAIERAVKGSTTVINLVGILYETSAQTFEKAHVVTAENCARACRDLGVKNFVQMSAISADENSSSVYARTKGKAERVVREIFPSTVILRPSVIFGKEDNFFNMFASLSKYLPALPLIGGGSTRFQPVYVEDVAMAAKQVLEQISTFQGNTFELGGPSTYTFKELMEKLLQWTGRTRLLLPIPFPIAEIQGSLFQLLPTPLLTRDQVILLKQDNVVDHSRGKTFADLGIAPRSIDEIVPSYL